MNDSDIPLSASSREFLHQGDAGFEPGVLDKARLRARLSEALAQSPPSSAPASGALPLAQPAAPLGPMRVAAAKVSAKAWLSIGGLTLIGLGFSGGYVLGKNQAEAESPSKASSSALPSNSPSSLAHSARDLSLTGSAESHPRMLTQSAPENASDDPSTAPLPALSAPPARSASAAEKSGSSSSAGVKPTVPNPSPFIEETNLLRRAQQALHEGNSYLARDLLDEGDYKFPKGILVQDRSAARIILLCLMGHAAQAKKAALAFNTRYPSSVHSERIARSCAK